MRRFRVATRLDEEHRVGMPLTDLLAPDVPQALEELKVPVFVLDDDGYMIYANAIAKERFGPMIGRSFTSFFAADSVNTAREAFARKILQVERTSEYSATVIDKRGVPTAAEFSCVLLERKGRVLGVFGLMALADPPSVVPAAHDVRLTPRQTEVLGHLAAGLTTDQMAARMRLSGATVRNHVRDLLRRLGVHSRLEAVIRAQELGLTRA